jgi:hypothetical protein
LFRQENVSVTERRVVFRRAIDCLFEVRNLVDSEKGSRPHGNLDQVRRRHHQRNHYHDGNVLPENLPGVTVADQSNHPLHNQRHRNGVGQNAAKEHSHPNQKAQQHMQASSPASLEERFQKGGWNPKFKVPNTFLKSLFMTPSN